MEYLKIINLLHNTPSQSTKFKTKDWVEINNDSLARYNAGSQIRFKISMLGSISCHYSDA